MKSAVNQTQQFFVTVKTIVDECAILRQKVVKGVIKPGQYEILLKRQIILQIRYLFSLQE